MSQTPMPMSLGKSTLEARQFWSRAGLLVGILWSTLSVVSAQVPPEQAAEMLLSSARRAYNEKNYPFAAQRFKEFMDRFGNHKEAQAARLGWALALLEGPERDYARAAEALAPIAGNRDFGDHPLVLYHLGLAHRGLGVRELAQAEAKPQEAAQRRATAMARFEEASRHFGAALSAYSARIRENPSALEWAARARCDQAETLLRAGKTKEAAATALPFSQEPQLAKSRFRTLGLYYHGYATFLLDDYPTAARSLNRAALFADPVFGTHARYLVGRIHHLTGENAEAAVAYEQTVADHTKNKAAAVEALRRPENFRNDPEEKTRLERLVNGRVPEHILRATLYLGVLLYENGRFGDAQGRMTAFLQTNPPPPLAGEAQLRLGFCQVQLRQFAEAMKTLQPLVDREPALADQALLWMAKCQIGLTDPAKPQEHDQALRTALETYRRAAEKAQQRMATEPEAKRRRAEILLEMADTQQLARQHKEAAATYGALLGEKALPAREEEILQRQATAYHLAGDYPESDRVCDRYQQAFPRGTLLPAVLFRRAENATFQALAAEKLGNMAERTATTARWNEEALKRYIVVVDRFPEFVHTPLARYGIAMCHYRKGELEKALKTLESIADADRSGDLALVPYVQADCLIRLAPTRADDALAAGQLEDQLKSAASLLETFVGAQPNSPQTPDALLKLGHCQARRAQLLAQPMERATLLASGRTAYERLLQAFPKQELVPSAILERAKILAQAGDVNTAVNELRRFSSDATLRAAPVTPMAIVQLSTYLRAQNKAAEAADLLQQCRQQHEATLRGDPARTGWVPIVLYHHGLCLKEAGKRPEARAVFDQILKQSPQSPEAAEAALRWGQSLKDEGQVKVIEVRKKRLNPLNPAEAAAMQKALDEGLKEVREAAGYLETQAEVLKGRQPPSESRGRMLYEAAWAHRLLAEEEMHAGRTCLQQERWQKAKDEAVKKLAPGQAPLQVPLPEVALTEVPVPPAEVKAIALYRDLISTAGDLSLTVDARVELAELLSDRGQHDPAIALLKESLDREPPLELAERCRLRLGICLDAKGDRKTALGQFAVILGNPKSKQLAQAYYRSGESLLALGELAEAGKHLAVFRDRGEFHNIPGVSDKALLRLGHALALAKQWDASRQAFETLVGRFGNSPWVHEARYGIGWAWQNVRQFDNAVASYAQVTTGTTSEVAARAQLQLGLCRLEQKRFPEASAALLVVPFTYDYPEWSAAALVEAARSFSEQKQNEAALKLLERVQRDHADSEWAKVARQRAEALRKANAPPT